MEQVETQLAELKAQLDALQKRVPENKLSMICFSGDMDKTLASFIIATGAVAMGMDVVMFFTFWGTPVLRAKNKSVGGKDMMGTMFGSQVAFSAIWSKSGVLTMTFRPRLRYLSL